MHNQSDFGYSSSACAMRCVACRSMELNCCDGKGGPFKARYKSLTIVRTDEGFCAQNGNDYAADNEPTLEDAKESIDAYWAEDQHGPLNGLF